MVFWLLLQHTEYHHHSTSPALLDVTTTNNITNTTKQGSPAIYLDTIIVTTTVTTTTTTTTTNTTTTSTNTSTTNTATDNTTITTTNSYSILDYYCYLTSPAAYSTIIIFSRQGPILPEILFINYAGIVVPRYDSILIYTLSYLALAAYIVARPSALL